MTFAEICLLCVMRALVAASLAGVLISPVQCTLAHSRPVSRRWLIGLLGALALCPSLLVGYFYNGGLLTLAQAPTWRAHWLPGWEEFRRLLANHLPAASELWLIVLMAGRDLPVGLLATVLLAPPPGHARQSHLEELRLRRHDLPAWTRWSGLVTVRWTASVRHAGPGWMLMFLAGFQEYELATRLGRPAWTAWLIDALAAGVDWQTCFGRLLIPVLLQLLLLAGLWQWGQGGCSVSQLSRYQNPPSLPAPSLVRRGLAWWTILWAAWWGVILPLGSLLGEAGRGASLLLRQPATLRLVLSESAVGLAVSGLAALGALAAVHHLSAMWQAGRGSSRWSVPWWLSGILAPGLLVPGLLGSLALGLVLLRVDPWLGRWGLASTLIPWGGGASVWLLPRAACLIVIADRWVSPRAVHAARMLRGLPGDGRSARGDQLLFQYLWRGRYWLWCLLCQMAFFDLPLAQLLAPPGMASAPASLYNQMHYGRAEVLSAMTVLVLVGSVTFFVLAGLGLIFSRPWIER